MNCTAEIKKNAAVLCLLLSSSFTLKALDTAGPHPSLSGTGSCFRLNPVTDGILLGTGLSLNITAKILENRITPVSFAEEDGRNSATVNGLDRLFIMPYSKPLDITSTILACTTVLTPAVLFTTEKNEWLTIGTMYTESLMLAWGIKEFGKNCISRYRPYMYTSGYPSDEVENGDYTQSFPSGHTTLAFTGAAFTTFVFTRYFPDSLWGIPVTAGSYALASATAVLRITSGSHYLTDVLAGAAIGTFAGLVVPWLHTYTSGKRSTRASGVKEYAFSAVPYGINVVMRF